MIRRSVRFALAIGQAAWLTLSLAAPAFGQTTATPSSQSTASALPQAGTFPITLILLGIGVVTLVGGLMIVRRPAPKQA